MSRKAPSLKWPLIVQPLVLQFAILFISVPILVALAVRTDSGGPYTDEGITPVIARAIVRGGDDRLEVRMTPELAELRSETPDLWFVAEDDAGRSVTFGQIPSQFASLVGTLSDLSYGHMRDRVPPYRLSAVIRREVAPAGTITVLGHGKLTRLSFIVIMASNIAAIPIFLLLALISLVVTPWIVRRSLAGVSRISREAEQINVGRRGKRLSEEQVPREIAPLVRAVNDALGRLDEGYERQRRFIASAAHELRNAHRHPAHEGGRGGRCGHAPTWQRRRALGESCRAIAGPRAPCFRPDRRGHRPYTAGAACGRRSGAAADRL